LDGVSASGLTCFSPESSACISGGKPEKGTDFAKSSSVHSGFSSSINSGFGFFTLTSLLAIGLSQTADPENAAAHRKNRRIKRIPNQAKSPSTNFSVIFARVDSERGRTQIEIRHHLKTKPALPKIAFALPGIKRDLHTCDYNRKLDLESRNCRIGAQPKVSEARFGASALH